MHIGSLPSEIGSTFKLKQTGIPPRQNGSKLLSGHDNVNPLVIIISSFSSHVIEHCAAPEDELDDEELVVLQNNIPQSAHPFTIIGGGR